METTFRSAEQTDIETLFQFMREYYELDHLLFDKHHARCALEKFVGDKVLEGVWLILYGSEAGGYIAITLGYSLEYGGRGAFIDELYIREQYRGQGHRGERPQVRRGRVSLPRSTRAPS